MSVMVPPEGTAVNGVNTSTGVTTAPAVADPTAMEVKIICPTMATASTPVETAVSALDCIWKPAVVAA